MDLADRLIEKRNEIVEEEQQGGQLYVDDLGIPTIVADRENPSELKNNVDYYVCRIIVLNNKKVSEEKQGRLHKRKGLMFIGNEVIDKTDANLFRLCKPQWPVPPHMKPQIWDRLYDLLPNLSYDKIAVTPNLVFNKKTGELEWFDEPVNTTGKGGFNG